MRSAGEEAGAAAQRIADAAAKPTAHTSNAAADAPDPTADTSYRISNAAADAPDPTADPAQRTADCACGASGDTANRASDTSAQRSAASDAENGVATHGNVHARRERWSSGGKGRRGDTDVERRSECFDDARLHGPLPEVASYNLNRAAKVRF